MSYELRMTSRAEKELDDLPDDIYRRIDEAVLGLADEPRPARAVKLTDSDGRWRIRVGEYRVLYTVDDAAEVVTIGRVLHRRDAYRKF